MSISVWSLTDNLYLKRSDTMLLFSETGQKRFRRVHFQIPNSVSLFALTEFRGESSVSSSQPIICVTKRTHFFFTELTEFAQNSVRLSEFSPPKQYSRNSIPPHPYILRLGTCLAQNLQQRESKLYRPRSSSASLCSVSEIHAHKTNSREHLKGGVTERGVFAFPCQYIVSSRGRTGNRTVTQMRHPLLVEGRPNCARQSLASARRCCTAPHVAPTSCCDPGRHTNVIILCLPTPCLNVP